MRILYIEDDASSRLVFAGGIRKYLDDCEVEAVETGEEGLMRLDTKNFDLLVTDLRLPGISGLDVLRECKKDHPYLEVIVLTGHSSVDSAVEAMRLGARDYIEKPLDIALMREKIENIRDYLSRCTELQEALETRDAVEHQADHDVHLLEAQVLKIRDAIDKALAVLSGGAMTGEQAAAVQDILAPFSSLPEQEHLRGK